MTEDMFLPLDLLSTRLGLPLEWMKQEAEADRIPFLSLGGDEQVFHLATVRRVLARRAGEGWVQRQRAIDCSPDG